MGWFDKFTEAAKDIGKGAVGAVDGVVRATSDVVAGRSLDSSLEGLGASINKGMGGFIDLQTGGQTEKVDSQTGGLASKFKSGFEIGGNLLQGKSVTQNIKDSASILLQAGQMGVGATGVNVGGFDLTDFTTKIMGGINNKLQRPEVSIPETYSPNPINFVNPNQASYNGEVAPKNYAPLIAIAAVGGIILLLVMKRKK